jgi:uncharacterized protein (TIGR03067 family)
VNALVFLILPVVCCGHGKQTARVEATDASQLHGTWNVLVFDFNGYWLSGYGSIGEYYRNLDVTFTEERLRLSSRGKPPPLGIEVAWHEAYKIDPTKRPKEIDVNRLGWSFDGKATKTDQIWRGIYDLQGDKLVICINRDGKRPQEFCIRKGQDDTIMLLQREKPKEGKQEKGKTK